MNKLGITTTAIALLGSTTFALAQNQLETVLDLAVRGMIDNGATVTYDDRITGGDGSVEYKNIVIINPDSSVTLKTDWIKGVPSAADPSTVTFTTADKVSVSGTDKGMDYSFDLVTSGMEFTTNALLREAMSTAPVAVNFKADSFRIKGGNPDSPLLRKLLADFGSVKFNMVASDTDKHTEGSLDLSKFDMAYDFTASGQTQSGQQSSGPASVIFNLDIPQGQQDIMGFIDGSKSASLTVTGGKSTFDTSVDDGKGVAFQMAGVSDPSSFVLQVVDGILTYDLQAGAVQMTVTPGGGMPIPPVDLGLSQLGMKIVLPIGAMDAPAKANVNLLLSDLSVGEGLWSMIDPGKTIPRDPAQINIDLEAMIQTDPAVAAAGGDPMQLAKIFSLDINRFLLSVGGAKAEAGGALTFNNDGPVPMPLGKINIEVNGITGLANKLVALGLLDQMQSGMALGIMMAFGKPGDNPDQFLSEITFTDSGILANGQPIQ